MEHEVRENKGREATLRTINVQTAYTDVRTENVTLLLVSGAGQTVCGMNKNIINWLCRRLAGESHFSVLCCPPECRGPGSTKDILHLKCSTLQATRLDVEKLQQSAA